MRTELILFHRPNNGLVATGPIITGSASSTGWSERTNVEYSSSLNPNESNALSYLKARDGGMYVDLGTEEVDIPVNFNINDVREPDKVKTTSTKTIRIPGTPNNNRLFTHIYNISGDGWTKIGNLQVWTNYNPTIRKECIILVDGIQVLKGNLQLKQVWKISDGISNDKVEYEIMVNGDLGSIFKDVGTSKLNDLDFSEWDHDWSKSNVQNSWTGSLKRNNAPYSNTTLTNSRTVEWIKPDPTTSRMRIKTTIAQGYDVEDFVRINIQPSISGGGVSVCANGTWAVAEVFSTTEFSINHPFPIELLSASSWDGTKVATPNGTVKLETVNGRGYVYPMAHWGDNYDENSFPVTSFAPSYFVKEIWDKIFDYTSSKYESTFLNSQFFKRLVLTQKKTQYELTQAQINERKFFVGSTLTHTNIMSKFKSWNYLNTTTPGATTSNSTDYLQTAVNSTITTNRYPFSVETGIFTDGSSFGDPSNNFANNIWTVQKNGEYTIGSQLLVDSWIDIEGPYGGTTSNGGTSSVPLPNFGLTAGNTQIQYNTGHKSQTNTSGIMETSLMSGSSIEYKPFTRVSLVLVREKNGTRLETVLASTDFITNNNPYTYGSTKLTSTNPDWPYFGRYQRNDWISRTLRGNHTSYFAKDEKVWIEVKHYTHANSVSDGQSISSNLCSPIYYSLNLLNTNSGYSLNPVRCKWYLRTRGVSTFGNEPSPISGENSTIYGKEFLPKDMTCSEFLKNIIKTFNLVVEPDREVERLYHIEPRDDYYYDGSNPLHFEEWKGKDESKTTRFKPLGELIAKNYIFSNKTESDYWNKRFNDERGRPYSLYKKEISNDFLNNEFKIETSFGSTVMINYPENSDIVMPSVIQKDTNSIKPVSSSAPRMLIWGGLRPYANKNGNGIRPNENTFTPGLKGWELLTSTSIIPDVGYTASFHTHYPYAGTVDSPLDPLWDINWFGLEDNDFVYWDGARWTNANLYNNYWSNYILEISDPGSMVVWKDIRLTSQDIFNIDFKKIYVIDGVWYRLQKIIDFIPSRLTQVELLKLKRPSRWRKVSVTSDTAFEEAVDYSRPVPVTTTSKPPIRKTFRSSSFVNSTPYNSGNGTIVNTGLANSLGDNLSNINLNGNEISIGSGSKNIRVDSNGVSIAANLNDVTVIGTPKISVNESNVTYINGVRYKNGVPISRANVINGGITTATSSLSINYSSTTTANVINGGEDIILSVGSNSWENVIDGGRDSILKDVPELGLSTRTTPSPKTNYSGGADYISPTQSYVDIVRQTKRAI